MELKIIGVVIVALAVILVTGIFVFSFKKTEITIPPNTVLFHKNTDCLEGQYCGFQPGYTAAVCRGQATSNKPNLE